MKHLKLAVLIAAALATPAYAQQPAVGTTDHTAHHVAQAKIDAALADGEVRKVDKDAKKITLRHGPIQNLDMPAMTMVFRSKDPAMLDKVKAGDSIRFKADKLDGVFTVTEYQPAK